MCIRDRPYTDEYTLHDGHDLFFVFYVNTNDFQPLLVLDDIMQKKLARGSTVAWHEAVGNIVNLRTVPVSYTHLCLQIKNRLHSYSLFSLSFGISMPCGQMMSYLATPSLPYIE